MSQGYVNNSYNTTGIPLYNGTMQQPVVTQQGQSVSVVPDNGSQQQIYQYPQTSLYGQQKQAASGVNIVIYNPSGYSNGSGGNVPYYPLAYPGSTQVINNIPQQPAPVVNNNIDASQALNGGESGQSGPVANTPISGNETASENQNVKKKKITKITDDYIKTLESYLRSDAKDLRKKGISQIINLCDEDISRYNDPALIALINIALQDSDVNNRIYAMTPLSAGTLGGDKNTVKLLQNLSTSDKLYGQEASMANESLLKIARDTEDVPDYSSSKK